MTPFAHTSELERGRDLLAARRDIVRRSERVIGLDHAVASKLAPDRWTLCLMFLDSSGSKTELKRLTPARLSPEQLVFWIGHVGNTRAPLRATSVRLPEHDRAASIEVDLVASELIDLGPDAACRQYVVELRGCDGLDELLGNAVFTLDGKATRVQGETVSDESERDADLTPSSFLAKEYDAFRELMLVGMRLAVPGWRETSPADLGVTLIEALAYSADMLSYAQDAAAAEAYLRTARNPRSIDRHARLAGYAAKPGSSARCWVWIEVATPDQDSQGQITLPAGTRIETRDPRGESIGHPEQHGFFTLHRTELRKAWNAIRIHGWGGPRSRLAAGATHAMLVGRYSFKSGQVLILEETQKASVPGSGSSGRAFAVRLREDAVLSRDEALGLTLTSVRWYDEDALPEPFTVLDVESGTLGVVRGNTVLVEDGIPTPAMRVGPVPDHGEFRPKLPQFGMAGACPYIHATEINRAASSSMLPDPCSAELRVWLYALPNGGALTKGLETEPWRARRDLLGAGPHERVFVMERESNEHWRLRFGDGQLGQRPPRRRIYEVVAIAGSGARGNLPAGSLKMVRSPDPRVLRAHQPLPAIGGIDADSPETVRKQAPSAWRRIGRCLLPEDFVDHAESLKGVRRASCTLEWTGAYTVAKVYVDTLRRDDPANIVLLERVRESLQDAAVVQTRVRVEPARHVAIDVYLQIRTAVHADREQIRMRLHGVFSGCVDRVLDRSGEAAWFSKSRFSLGDDVNGSKVLAVAERCPGVQSASLTRLSRVGESGDGNPLGGLITIGNDEVACAASIEGRPDLGTVRFVFTGGAM